MMKQLMNRHYSNSAQQNRHSISSLITVYIKSAQAAFVKYLQLKTEGLTNKKKKLLLLLFSLLFGGCSVAILVYSFVSASIPLRRPAISFPKYAAMHLMSQNVTDSAIRRKEYEHIHQFKLFLEHLQQSSSGKMRYDSLVQIRPYLLDSIRQVDSIFFNQ